MKNIQKTRDWMHMALKEFDAARADFKDEILATKILEIEEYVKKHGTD